MYLNPLIVVTGLVFYGVAAWMLWDNHRGASAMWQAIHTFERTGKRVAGWSDRFVFGADNLSLRDGTDPRKDPAWCRGEYWIKAERGSLRDFLGRPATLVEEALWLHRVAGVPLPPELTGQWPTAAEVLATTPVSDLEHVLNESGPDVLFTPVDDAPATVVVEVSDLAHVELPELESASEYVPAFVMVGDVGVCDE